MVTLTITLSEERWAQVKEKAECYGVPPEELLRVSLEELLARPDDIFQQAVEYVLTKNRELYERLAKT